MHAAPTIILLLGGLAFVGFAVACILWPTRMAAPRDLALATPTARADFLATYGGFQLGVGVFLIVSAAIPAWTHPGLWAILMALTGFASLRMLGITLARGQVRRSMWLALALEVGGICAAGWALSQPA
jgi:hypothetical protein